MLPSACVGGRALPLDATPEATWGTSEDVLVQLGVRAIQFGIAAMFLGFVLKSASLLLAILAFLLWLLSSAIERCLNQRSSLLKF